MREGVHPRCRQRLGVGEIEDVRRDAHALFVRFGDGGLEDRRLHLGELAVDVVDPELEHVGMVRRGLAHLGDGLLRRHRAVDLVGSGRDRRRSVGHADSAAGGEERRAGKLAALLLVTDLVDEVAVQAERDDRRHAVLLELLELRADVLARVAVGFVLAVHHQPDVAVRADQAGDDGATAGIDGARPFGDRDLAGRAHRDDVVPVDHHHRVVDRRRAGAVDQPRSLDHHRLRE